MSQSCSICLEDLNKTNDIILSCNHLFHKKCISQWYDSIYLHKIKTCPLCRHEININDKKNIITGLQFAVEMHHMTNKIDWLDAYTWLLEIEYNNIDTGITLDEVFQIIVGWRDNLYTELCDDEPNLKKVLQRIIEWMASDPDDLDNPDMIQYDLLCKYNNMIDECVIHFDLKKQKMKKI